MRQVLNILFFFIALQFTFGCSTSPKNSEAAQYQIRAKIWVDGLLKSTPMVNTMEGAPAEIVQSNKNGDESFGLKFLILEKRNDLFVMDVDYSFHSGATADGNKIKVKGSFNESIVVEENGTKIEFSVVKI